MLLFNSSYRFSIDLYLFEKGHFYDLQDGRTLKFSFFRRNYKWIKHVAIDKSPIQSHEKHQFCQETSLYCIIAMFHSMISFLCREVHARKRTLLRGKRRGIRPPVSFFEVDTPKRPRICDLKVLHSIWDACDIKNRSFFYISRAFRKIDLVPNDLPSLFWDTNTHRKYEILLERDEFLWPSGLFSRFHRKCTFID